MGKKKVLDLVDTFFDTNYSDGDYLLYDSEFLKEGPDYYLRIYIDRKDGDYIGTDDCENVSRALSDYLDREDPIEQTYFLEVSSPGMDRVLKKEEHFMAYMGEEVEVSLYKPINGEKKITGELISYEKGEVGIRLSDKQELLFKEKEIAKVNLSIEWR